MARSRELVLAALGDHKPKSMREVVETTGLSQGAACNVLASCWRKGIVLRTKDAIYEFERRFKGRAACMYGESLSIALNIADLDM